MKLRLTSGSNAEIEIDLPDATIHDMDYITTHAMTSLQHILVMQEEAAESSAGDKPPANIEQPMLKKVIAPMVEAHNSMFH